MDAEDSARVRDLLASNRTLLAWVRTALSFAALGFAGAASQIASGALPCALLIVRLSDYLAISAP